jgi:thiamine biosynthesis lipoprotein
MRALVVPAVRTVLFPLWGGEATVAVSDGGQLETAAEAVRDVVEDFDRACSPFRADSELTAVNRAAGAPARVSPLFAQALAAALDAAALTGGAVDPTVGTLTLAFNPPDGDGPRVHVRRVPGWRTVALDPERRRLWMPREAQLDLGATAKALAADHAAQEAAEAAGCGVLVSLLGDLAIAGPPPPAGWPVRVTDDHRAGPGAPGQTIVLRDGGLATSSRTVRHPGGDPARHHVFDPVTGAPAQGPWRTVSVHGASCLEANIVSTALLVAGRGAERLLHESELPARLVTDDGGVEHRHDWPAGRESGEARP